MLNQEILKILSKSKAWGWVLEPEAKRLLALSGIAVPRFAWAKTPDEAIWFAEQIGYPLIAKVVSPSVIHKTEVKGVALNIENKIALTETFHRFSAFDDFQGVLVEETLQGVEVIVGAKIDDQFGPVILLGVGGTGVEIYQDVSLRMAPIMPEDVESMVKGLKAHRLFEGYRGSEPINIEALTRMLMDFSSLIMALDEKIMSIDLNPVFCSAATCTVGDARIMLPES